MGQQVISSVGVALVSSPQLTTYSIDVPVPISSEPPIVREHAVVETSVVSGSGSTSKLIVFVVGEIAVDIVRGGGDSIQRAAG